MPHLDLSNVHDIEISIRPDGTVLWVNTAEGCVLRICRITGDIIINDEREFGTPVQSKE